MWAFQKIKTKPPVNGYRWERIKVVEIPDGMPKFEGKGWISNAKKNFGKFQEFMVKSIGNPGDQLQKKLISSTAKIGLSCDIKYLFRKSVDKRLKNFTSIFHPVLLQFYDSSYHFSYSTQHNLSITKINK